jgi:SAM-dependent methyltransferase
MTATVPAAATPREARRDRACRACAAPLETTFVDLGLSPLSNSYVEPAELHLPERFYPLHAWLCERCFLVQLEEFEAPEAIFSDYAYFSSFADSWLRHAKAYVEEMTPRLGLGPSSLVMEVASNDGYLLQYFVQKGIGVLGIEPARNVAAEAERRGVPTLVRFFGRQTAAELVREGRRADLLLGNNVLAHVPDLNDFVAGLALAVKPTGTITLEFPHLVRLIEGNQFDTIYHEHFSYLSLFSVERLFETHGLRVVDVEELPTHGGSLRVFARPAAAAGAATERLERLRAAESRFGIDRVETYRGFRRRVEEGRWAILEFLIGLRRAGKRVAAYGAPAKGNTLLNYCGIRSDLVAFTADRSPHKQGRFLPGSRIAIFPPERIREERPDYVVILPWNLTAEITEQLSFIRSWGGRFVVLVPGVQVLP